MEKAWGVKKPPSKGRASGHFGQDANGPQWALAFRDVAPGLAESDIKPLKKLFRRLVFFDRGGDFFLILIDDFFIGVAYRQDHIGGHVLKDFIALR